MAKVLYIKGNPKSIKESTSLTLGDKFLKEYKSLNSEDEIIEIDVYKDNITEIDKELLYLIENSKKGVFSDKLEESLLKKFEDYNEITNQFMEADKYIFATPMWNLSLPDKVKTYIDAVCVAGKTFKYTATGPVGLLRNKKCIHLHSSGGFHSKDPKNHADNYLRDIMTFMGIDEYKSLVIEGYSAIPDKAESIFNEVYSQIPELVYWFEKK